MSSLPSAMAIDQPVIRGGFGARLSRPTAYLMPGVMVLTVAYAFLPWMPLALISHVLLVAFIVGQWTAMERLPRLIIVVGVGMVVVLPWFADNPAGTLFQGMNRAAWFASFIGGLSFLKVASGTSALVRRCGEVIISQPPALRYLTLSAGTFLISVPLNLAVINLVGVMVRRANTLDAAGGSETIRQVRDRRMFSAMIRGLGLMTLGSPLNMTLALLLSLLPGLRWWAVLPLSLLTATVLLAFGWTWDRLTAPRLRSGLAGPRQAPPDSLFTVGRFMLLVLGIFASVVLVEQALGVSLPMAVLLTSPVAGFVWMYAQRRRLGTMRAAKLTTARLIRGAPAQFSGLRSEVTVLAGAALMGTLIASALPTATLADQLAGAGLHGHGVAVLVVLFMVVAPQLGMNSLLAATILVSVINQPELFGIGAEQLALAVMSGWALSVSSSPVAASVLMTSRLAGVTPQTLCWSWHGWFTVVGTVFMALWVLALGYLFF